MAGPGHQGSTAFDLLGGVRRRTVLTLMAGGLLAGCGARTEPAVVPSSVPSGNAAADDYAWFSQVRDLSKGFCFVWVRGVRPAQVLERMGAEELERIGWQQLVGAGDGQRGATDKRYFGVSRISDDWSLTVEDNGSLGRADELLRPLSVGTSVVVVHRDAAGTGRFLLLADQTVRLEFDPMSDGPRAGTEAARLRPVIEAAGFGGATAPGQRTAAAFALAERLTGVRLELGLLQERTYLFSVVSTPL